MPDSAQGGDQTITEDGGTRLTTPAGAQAAGFVTLAANYDFSKPLPADWLGCGSWDGIAHSWYQATNPTNAYDGRVPCEITQTTDPQYPGTTAIAIPWKSTCDHSFWYANILMDMSPEFDSSNWESMVSPPKYPNGYFEY